MENNGILIECNSSLAEKKEESKKATIIDEKIDTTLPTQESKNVDNIEENNTTNDKQENLDKTKKKKEAVHVIYGNMLIETLGLIHFNNNIYYYQDGVYKIVSDTDLSSAILKYINPATEPAVCKKTNFYIRHLLYDDKTIEPNTNFVNFKNGLYDLSNQTFIAHSPNIFTLNQLAIDYSDNLQYNEEVDEYLNSIANFVAERKLAILQMIGYLLTSKNDIQKILFIYGPSASNGKSVLLKIIEKIIGSNNVCHKSIEEFEKEFGAIGMEYKLLNISTELPATRIKDVSVLKKSVTGDTFETHVKFEQNKTIKCYIKHLFASNFFPNVADNSEGYFRRLHIILLDNKFDPTTSKFNIDKFCSPENLNYLGNLAFKEYLKMRNSGSKEFANSKESEKIVANYRKENDSVLSFLTDEDTVKNVYGNYVSRDTMYKLYKSFCSLNEYSSLGKKTFYRELEDKYKFSVHVKENGTKYCFYREKPV